MTYRYRHQSLRLGLLATTVLSTMITLPAVAQTRQAPTGDGQAKTEIERGIRDLKLGASRVTVAVQNHVVSLDGTVPSLWLKRQIIDRARKTKGIVEVDSTIDIARAESDEALSDEVGKQIRE